MSRAELAARQAVLVNALVAGGKLPDGIDGDRLEIARQALLRKRAGEVATTWPLLATSMGHGWTKSFAQWAQGRTPQGSLRDGWDLARELAAVGALTPLGHDELAAMEVIWRYNGRRASRRRLLPALRRVAGGVIIGLGGRARRL